MCSRQAQALQRAEPLWRSLRGGSAVRHAGCSFREPEFSPQHLHQWLITIACDSSFLLMPEGTCMCVTYMALPHMDTQIKINLIFPNIIFLLILGGGSYITLPSYSSQVYPPTFGSLHSPPPKNYTKSNLWYPNTHWNMVNFQVIG